MSSFSGFNYRPQGAISRSSGNHMPYDDREPSSGRDFNHPPWDYGETGGEPRYANYQGYREPKYALNVKSMISALTVLVILVLLVYFLHVYAKWIWREFARFARRRSASRPHRFNFTGEEPARLRNVGLDSVVLETLPVFLYKSQNFTDCLECAVCLCEFEENEKARLLPNCKHSFHVECIDMWFRSHSTCPVCRTGAQPEQPVLESVRRAGFGYNTRVNSFRDP